jgi:hypothetical protein
MKKLTFLTVFFLLVFTSAVAVTSDNNYSIQQDPKQKLSYWEVNENEELVAIHTVYCPSGFSYSIENRPQGLNDSTHSVGGGTYDIFMYWTPTYCQAGTYNFIVSVPCMPYIYHDAIKVLNVNRLPTISATPGYQEILKGKTATASIGLSVDSARGGTLTDNYNGTGSFGWTPGFDLNVRLYNFTFMASDNYSGQALDTVQIQLRTLCGDASSDGQLNVTDVIKIINYLFKGGQAPVDLAACDVNNDGKVNVNDVITLINYLFKGGTKPDCGY